MSYQIDLTQKSLTYISRPGASVGDRAYFITDPEWLEKHTESGRIGSTHPTVGGGAVIQSFPRLTTGRPLTLAGDDKHGLLFTGEAEKLRDMFDEGITLEFSDDGGTTKISVVPDRSKDNPIDMKAMERYYKKVLTGSVYLLRV